MDVYHMENKGACTRYDVARQVLDYLRRKDVVLNPLFSAASVLPAPRVGSEILRNHALELRGMGHMRDWREELDDYLKSAPLTQSRLLDAKLVRSDKNNSFSATAGDPKWKV